MQGSLQGNGGKWGKIVEDNIQAKHNLHANIMSFYTRGACVIVCECVCGVCLPSSLPTRIHIQIQNTNIRHSKTHSSHSHT